jgi:hypothetical protein
MSGGSLDSMSKVTMVGFRMTNCASDRHVPRPNGVAVELHKSIVDVEG